MTSRLDFHYFANSICKSVEERLRATPAIPLTKLESFQGTGFYALYYIGRHRPVLAYEPTAKRNRFGRFEEPIYVGIGSAKKWRGEDITLSRSAYRALRLHAKNIGLAKEHMVLDVRDFYYKFIPTDPVNAEIAERVWLDRHAPIWNSVIKGFANHHVGTTRYSQRRTRWDVLHMGRPWAAQCQWTPEGTEEILKLLTKHYAHQDNVRKMMRKEHKDAQSQQMQLQLVA